MYVVDLVDVYIVVVEKNKFDNFLSLYNVGTGSGVSMREFVETCKKVMGVDIEIYYCVEFWFGDYVEVYVNVDKIKYEFGWEVKYTDLYESLTYAWKFRKMKGDIWEL